MLNSHCNTNDNKKLKKRKKQNTHTKKKSIGLLDANPRYTDCKTTALLTKLRSSVIRIDKNIRYMLKMYIGKNSAVFVNVRVY